MIVFRLETPPVQKIGPTDAWWRALHRIADDLEGDTRVAFLRAVRSLQAKLDLRNLEDALLRNRLDESALWDALSSELDSALKAPLRDAVVGGGDVAARRLPRGSLRFDLTNPKAVQAVDTEVANLVREITAESRAAIRDLVRQSVQGAFDVRQLARQIRGSIGLTSPYALAVENFRAAAVARGMAPGLAVTRSQAYADRLLRHRAETIARTEVIRATNAGQQAVWEDARNQGLLTGDAQRVWIVTPDDRLCPRCAPLDGVTVGLQEDFPGGVGYPPLHPNCRCAIGIATEDYDDGP